MNKISELSESEISNLPHDLQEIIAEHKQDVAEFNEVWGKTDSQFKSSFLKEFGRNGKFFIDGQEVATNFLDEVEEVLLLKIKNKSTNKPINQEAPAKKTKSQLENMVKGYQIKLKRAQTETEKTNIQKTIKGYEITLKRAK
jgi:hypothetical protein